MKTITLTETKQPCYDVYIYLIGIKKKERKEKSHSLKLFSHVAIEEIFPDSDMSTITQDVYNKLKAMAVKEREANFRTWRAGFKIKLNYIKVSKDSGFISTEFSPFGDNQHAISVVEA